MVRASESRKLTERRKRAVKITLFNTYSVELQNHCGETRTLRVTPFANVSGP